MGTSHQRIWGWLRIYWQRGQVKNALAPLFASCGAKGKIWTPGVKKRGRPPLSDHLGINIDDDVREKIEYGFRFLKSEKTFVRAYNKTMKICWSREVIIDGQPIRKIDYDNGPTLEQFSYWLKKKFTLEEFGKAICGRIDFEQNHRARTGTSIDKASGPGSVYQIDSTIADIFLRSRIDPRRWVGRPVLYIVVDLYSRMIVGFYTCLYGPSWEGAMHALYVAMTDKVALCARYGISIATADWPCAHLCSELVCDRGPEFKEKSLVVLVTHSE